MSADLSADAKLWQKKRPVQKLNWIWWWCWWWCGWWWCCWWWWGWYWEPIGWTVSLISILSVLQLAPRLNPKLVKVVMMRIQTLNNCSRIVDDRQSRRHFYLICDKWWQWALVKTFTESLQQKLWQVWDTSTEREKESLNFHFDSNNWQTQGQRSTPSETMKIWYWQKCERQNLKPCRM